MRSLQDRFGRVIESGDPIVVAVLAATALVEVLVPGGSMLDAVVGAAIALPLLARPRGAAAGAGAGHRAGLCRLREGCECRGLAAGVDRAQRRALQRRGALRARAR